MTSACRFSRSLRTSRLPVRRDGEGRMEEVEVIVRIEGSAGRITLNRPRALNALNANMCLAIAEALMVWRDDERVELILIDGAGDRAFCAGGDVRVVAESGKTDGVEARRFFHAEYRMN